MKHLLISLSIVLIMISSWVCFDIYSVQEINKINNNINVKLISSIENEQWDTSLNLMKESHEMWLDYRKIAMMFLENDSIREIDMAMSKVTEYIKAEDVSNSSGELSYISQLLSAIDQQERLTMANIF